MGMIVSRIYARARTCWTRKWAYLRGGNIRIYVVALIANVVQVLR